MREQTITFFTKAHFWFFFFSKSCLKVGGAAYTRVRLIHEFLRYSATYARHCNSLHIKDFTFSSIRPAIYRTLMNLHYQTKTRCKTPQGLAKSAALNFDNRKWGDLNILLSWRKFNSNNDKRIDYSCKSYRNATDDFKPKQATNESKTDSVSLERSFLGNFGTISARMAYYK